MINQIISKSKKSKFVNNLIPYTLGILNESNFYISPKLNNFIFRLSVVYLNQINLFEDDVKKISLFSAILHPENVKNFSCKEKEIILGKHLFFFLKSN